MTIDSQIVVDLVVINYVRLKLIPAERDSLLEG